MLPYYPEELEGLRVQANNTIEVSADRHQQFGEMESSWVKRPIL